ncbi:MAG: response regulator [Desulfobacterales bacterium]|nr:response regulator [Desulfobacterales bacterium]
MRLGIREKLLIPIIAIVLAGMASIILYFYFSSTRAIQQAASNGLVREVDLSVKLMDDWMAARKQDMTTWSAQQVLVEALSETGYYGRSARLGAVDYLRGLNRGYGYYDLLFIADLAGRPVAASRDLGKKDFDIANRSYFQKAKAGKLVVSDIIIGQDHGLKVFVVSVPVRKDGRVVGVLTGGVKLAMLSDLFVGGFRLGRDGYAFLAAGDGRIITRSSEIHPSLDALDRFDFGRKMLSEGRGVAIYSMDGIKLISSYGRMQQVPWLFVATQSLDEAFAPSLRTGTYSVVTGLAILLVVSLVIGFLFRRTVYTPINEMLRVMGHVEQGELYRRAKSGGGGDEIGKLTTAFNTMIGRLEKTVNDLTSEVAVRRGAETALAENRDNLEKLVGERTLELENEVSVRWRAEMSLRSSEARLRRQTETLRALARQKPLFSGDLKAALPVIIEAAARTMGVSNASVWLFEKLKVGLACVECYPPDPGSGEEVRCVQPPDDYLEKLEMDRVWSASDARCQGSHFRRCGKAPSASSDRAFLEAAIMLGGKLKGVVSFKHDGPDREWKIDEQNFATSIADFVSLALETFERLQAEKAKKNLEIRLHRSEKMEAIGTLAGGVAHDLNNILSGIVSYPELLLMQLPEDSPLAKPLRTIRESGEKAAAIVQDLLTLARRGVSVTEVVSLNDIIEKYLKSPEFDRLMVYHPEVIVNVSLAPDLMDIAGSPVHLSKTIMNLVANASEAMPTGGELSLKTENRYVDQPIRGYDNVEEGDYVVVTVLDSGVGILEKDLGRIFEPFFTKKKMGRSGTGLGMAVVWGTVKDHNGYIDFQSREGAGTLFTLYFPVTRQVRNDISMPVSSERLRGNGETILVVDDIAEQREIAHSILNLLGYRVDTVASGEAAVAYLNEKSADLLVLDMIMDPGMDGLDTFRAVVRAHPGQRSIITSGFSETDRIKEALRLGVSQYLKKPYVIENFGTAVRNALSS